MKLNDFISEYHEMLDNPNEVLEFFKLAYSYLNPSVYNNLCKMLRDASVNFDWQAIINQTNYITDYKEIPSNIDNNVKLDSFINDTFKSTLISTNIYKLNITFNTLNNMLHSYILSSNMDEIDGEIADPKAIIHRFYFTFITDDYSTVSLYIFFVDKYRTNYLCINIPISAEEQDLEENILWFIPHQAILYNENNVKKLIDDYNDRINDLIDKVVKG